MRTDQPYQVKEPLFYTLNPEMKQEQLFITFNQRVKGKSQQVEKQFKNKSATRTNTQQQNEHPTDYNSEDQQQVVINQQKRLNFGSPQWIKQKKMSLNKNRSSQNSIEDDQRQSELSKYKRKSLFQRVTINCLRSKKHQIDEQSIKAQNFYRYTISKIDKIKRQESKKVRQTQKIQRVVQFKRKSIKQIAQAKHYHEEVKRKRNQQLKSQVLIHRSQKEQFIQKTKDQKAQLGISCRLHSQEMSQFLSKQVEKKRKQKQILFMKQKIDEFKRSEQMAKINEQKRKRARLFYQKKWLQQLHSVQISNEELSNKKRQLSYQLRTALISFSESFIQQ